MARCEDKWTEAEDGRLADMWNSGVVATEIAKELRRSKNSILGRRRRLGLPFRKEPVQRVERAAVVYAKPPPDVRHPCAGCGVHFDRHEQSGCDKYRSAYSAGAF